MKMPESITVTALDENTQQPINNVALVLVLFAEKKNDYYVGPMITDSGGKAMFRRVDCERAMVRAQEMFVMDYAGDVESLRPQVAVRLHRPEHIATMLHQLQTSPSFWRKAFENPDRLLTVLPGVRNAEFAESEISASEEKLSAEPSLTLYLRKRSKDES